MRSATRFHFHAWSIALVLWLGVAAAQEPVVDPAADPAVDPPGRVARLSLAEGDVALAPAGTEEWGDALLNRPLTTGDKLWVDRGGRAELQVGSALVHLDQITAFGFTELDDRALRMSLTEGTAVLRVRRRAEDEVIEVYTPNATVSLLHPGEYQISVSEQGDRTVVRTRSGESEVASNTQIYRVSAGQEGVFTGMDSLMADIGALGPRTAFENWANERDRRERESQSARYVSRDVIGYEDLDEHGTWVHEPQYGHVWRPRTYIVSDWAPYRYGRWIWVRPWGWTWVDHAPWGFAPFHYGRWVHLRNHWCWVPGPKHFRPVYAPALVGWIGSPGVSVSISFGHGIGWFPLGPREVYIPGYRYSHHYLRNVNVSNTLIVNNTYITNVYRGRGRDPDYRHRHLPHAITVVRGDHFVRGRRVDNDRLHLNDRQLRGWRTEGRPPDIAPVRESVFAGSPRPAGNTRADRAWNDGPKAGRGDFVRPPVRSFSTRPQGSAAPRGNTLLPRSPETARELDARDRPPLGLQQGGASPRVERPQADRAPRQLERNWRSQPREDARPPARVEPRTFTSPPTGSPVRSSRPPAVNEAKRSHGGVMRASPPPASAPAAAPRSAAPRSTPSRATSRGGDKSGGRQHLRGVRPP